MNINNSKIVFWCGSLLSYDGLKRYGGESPAAKNWTKGLLNGILENNVDVQIFSPIWDSLFPKGRLFPGSYKYLEDGFSEKLVHYINFPWIKSWSLSFMLFQILKKAIKKEEKEIIIINYNPSPHYCKAISKIKKKYSNIKWINITLDLDNPELDNWKTYKRRTFSADGHVFLSWWAYLNAPVNNKLHLDSGWNSKLKQTNFPHDITKNPKRILYTGKLCDYGGLPLLIAAINDLRTNDVIFEFYGKGNYPPLNVLAKKDKRVKIKGFVSDDELHRACINAYAFLSPIDSNWISSKMNFPSKNFLYLQYKKPVVSQLLDGMSPEFRNVLYMPEKETGTSWKNTIEKVVNLTATEIEENKNRIDNFLKNRTWFVQAKRLLDFALMEKQ